MRELSAAQGFSGKKLAELMERVELGSPFTGLETSCPSTTARLRISSPICPKVVCGLWWEPAQIAERLKVRAEDLSGNTRRPGRRAGWRCRRLCCAAPRPR